MKCKKCGAELPDNVVFCPQCGQKIEAQSGDEKPEVSEVKVDEQVAQTNAPEQDNSVNEEKTAEDVQPEQFEVESQEIDKDLYEQAPRNDVVQLRNDLTAFENTVATTDAYANEQKKRKKRIIVIASVAVVLVVAIIAAIVIINPHEHEYGLYNVKRKPTFTSSGKKVRVCEICGQEDVAKIPKLKLKSLYDEYCESPWAELGSDESYLSIDTNPYNYDSDSDYSTYYFLDAYEAVENINEALELPDSLLNEMGETTSLMGKQTETYDDIGITVSWTYHPDNGLEVTYKIAN